MNEANKLHERGIARYRAGDLDQAVDLLTQAHAAASAAGDEKQAAEILNDVAVVRRELGQLSQAAEILTQTYQRFAELGDIKGQAQATGNLANVLEAQEKHEEAAEAYRQSAKMFEEIGESDLAMYSWQALSRLHMKQKDWLPAMAAYEEGIENMPDGSVKKGLLQRIVQLPGQWLAGRR